MCVCVSVHNQMRLNYMEKIFEFYIYLNRRYIKLSYGEIIQFLSWLQLKLCLIYFFTLAIFWETI